MHISKIMTALVVATVVAMPATRAAADPGVHRPAPECHGQRATLVGTPGGTLRGTGRRDVILTNDAKVVRAGGGDDLICATGGTDHRSTEIYAGPGDDVVDAGAYGGNGLGTLLGSGRDTYLGSRYAEVVDAVAGGTDHVSTGAGDDTVAAGSSQDGRDHGVRDHDVVRLGAGDDTMGRSFDPSTVWRGGAGQDTVILPSDESEPTHDWRYDDVEHAAYRDGKKVVGWQGMERFYFPSLTARSVTFTGASTAEHVELHGIDVSRPISMTLGGGSDSVEVDLLTTYLVPAMRIDGGPGRDLVHAVGNEDDSRGYRLQADLGQGTFDVSDDDGHRDGTIAGVENLEATYFYDVTLTGDAQANHLLDQGSCSAALDGGPGDDRLQAYSYATAGCTGAVIHGGSGDDSLIGGDGDDALTGDLGTDTADGRAGTDSCSAETVVDCES